MRANLQKPLSILALALAAACGGPPEEADERVPERPSQSAIVPPHYLTNGGFESGLNSWTPGGTVSVVAGGHSGNSAAMIGATTPTNGESTLDQTFFIPTTGGVLSFWYKMTCPDNNTMYGWALAYVTDNTTGAGITMLPTICVTNVSWVRVSANVTSMAGHYVTLRLASHDDNYPWDPTYTLYDDVALSPAPGITCDADINNGLTLMYDDTGVCGPCHRNKTSTPRYVDNGNQTVTDRHTCLVWEKKISSPGNIHDASATYGWDQANDNTNNNANYPGWLYQLNTQSGSGFARHTDWRLPTSGGKAASCPLDGTVCAPCTIQNPGAETCAPAELESILVPNCYGQTCIDPAFGVLPPDLSVPYWSGSLNVEWTNYAYYVRFYDGLVDFVSRSFAYHVRAVRGGPTP
jgi:hypothetical protein